MNLSGKSENEQQLTTIGRQDRVDYRGFARYRRGHCAPTRPGGATVAFTYAASAAQAAALVADIQAHGGKALAIRADSRSAEDIERAVGTTIEHFGALNILVNNAGILGLGSADEFSVESLDNMYAVNVRAAYVANQVLQSHESR